jgi:tape measure domain-containing protein
MATNEEIKVVITADDRASGVLNNVGKTTGILSGKMASFAKIGIGAAGAAFAAGGVAAYNFGKAALSAASDLEQTKIAFTTMLGSAEKANEFTKELINFAKRTPFELTGLNQASKQLLAYGFAQEEVIPNLKALGDIASGVGMDKLPNLILAFGQVKAATRLTGMELRQFTEAGVPLLDQLSKQMGKSVKDIQEMVSAGEIGFPEVQKALKSLTEEGGRFNDLMTKQSQSLGGMISNLKDAWNQFLVGAGAPLMDWAKQFVGFLTDVVNTKLPPLITLIVSFATEVGNLYRQLKEKLTPTFTVLVELFNSQVLPSLQSLWNTLKTQLGPAIAELWTALQPYMPLLATMAKLLGTILVAAIYTLLVVLAKLLEGLAYVVTAIIKVNTTVLNAIRTVWEPLSRVFQTVADKLSNIIEKAQEAGKAISGIGSKVTGAVSKLNPFGGGKASGGSVLSGNSYVVGERGPEIFQPSMSGSIIPNNKIGSSGGTVINITGTFLSQDAAEKMAELLMDRLKLQVRI